MIRALFSLAFCVALSVCSITFAQTGTRAVVRVGDVTGVDLALEGGLEVVRGGHWRSRATVYEVVGLRDLRPASRASVRITSTTRGFSPIEITTDEHGHVLLDVVVPADASGVFSLSLDARVRNVVHRRFDLALSVEDDLQLRMMPIPTLAVGARVPLVASLSERSSMRPVAGREVRFDIRARGALLAQRTLRTNDAGIIADFVHVPGEPTDCEVSAVVTQGDDTRVLAQLGVTFTRASRSERTLYSELSAPTAKAGDAVTVESVLRDRRGMPIADAECYASGGGLSRNEHPLRTDARGHVRFSWQMPDFGPAAQDFDIQVTATSAAYGQANSYVKLRYVGQDARVMVVPESGAVSTTTSTRLFVVATDASGQVLANTTAQITAPALGLCDVALTTDASGSAVTSPSSFRPNQDACAEVSASSCLAGTTNVHVRLIGAHASEHDACVPVDPDRTLTIRALRPLVRGGESVEFELERGASVARAPVLVTLWSAGRVLAVTKVTASAARGSLALPIDFGSIGAEFESFSRLDLVARPLVGARQEEVKGGSTSLFAHAGSTETSATSRVRLPFDSATLRQQWTTQTQAAFLGAKTARLLDVSTRTDTLVAAFAACETPEDAAAPALLFDGELVARPASEATQRNFLRDPWRARARFVEGRLGRLFREIESAVENALPAHLGDFTVRTPHGREFSELLLDALPVDPNNVDQGARGLSGEPMTFTSIRSLDREFDFNHVARRVTRKRLFTLLLALREFVRARQLDLPWAVVGDPGEWLSQLQYSPEIQSFPLPSPTALLDAWGRPFVFRKVARARFSAITALEGYELVSAGPDGVAGNGDDVYDPTAPVLSATGVYGQAVGEAALVARLRTVELGRATASSLGGGGSPIAFERTQEHAPAFGTLASFFETAQLDAQRPAILPEYTPSMDDFVIESAATRNQMAPIAARMVAQWSFARTTEGAVGVLSSWQIEGARVLVHFEAPQRISPNEPLAFEAFALALDDEPHALSLNVRTEHGLNVQTPESIALRRGVSTSIPLVFSTSSAHDDRVTFEVREGDHVVHRTISAVESSDDLLGLRADSVGGPGESSWRTSIRQGDDASANTTTLVLVRANALAQDPDFHQARHDAPGLFAWSDAALGRPMRSDVRQRLLSSSDDPRRLSGVTGQPALDIAGALVALATRPPEDDEAAQLRASLLNTLRSTNWAAEGPLVRAALVALLAPLALDASQADMLSIFAMQNRAAVRADLLDQHDQPTLDAAAAAALLLVDARDGYGRALYERARTTLQSDPVQWALDANDADAAQKKIASLFAMAIAAHQYGDEPTRVRFIRLAMRSMTSPGALEGTARFWYLAAGVYGALGTTSSPVTVHLGASSREIAVHDAFTRVPVPSDVTRVGIDSSGGLVAHVTRRYRGAYNAQTNGPVALSIHGDPGSMNLRSAFELEISPSTVVSDLVIELSLPANADAADFVEGLRRARPNFTLSEISLRDHGVVRVRIERLASGSVVRLPLQWHWLAAGEVTGLGVVAYAADAPAQRTTLAPRRFSVAR